MTGVTAPESFTMRNAALLRRLGVGRISDEERAERVRRNEAQHHGKHCAGCGGGLGADDAVYRLRISLGPGPFGGHRHAIYPHCADCAKAEPQYGTWEECATCRRKVRQPDYRPRQHHFCSDDCSAAFYRKPRKAAEPIACEVCGETFEPSRADAKTCSGPCRQKAYRKRRALRLEEATTADAFDKCNARARP